MVIAKVLNPIAGWRCALQDSLGEMFRCNVRKYVNNFKCQGNILNFYKYVQFGRCKGFVNIYMLTQSNNNKNLKVI